MATALQTELVNAAIKTLDNSLAAYKQLPSATIGGLTPVNNHNVACGSNPQDTAQARQYMAALTWVMQGCLFAAQQAADAAQFIASSSPAARGFAQAAAAQLSMITGTQNDGTFFWATSPDWSNCPGGCNSGSISCSPSAFWLQNISLTITAAQSAVLFAQNALAHATSAPPPPPPPSPPITLSPLHPLPRVTLGATTPSALDVVRTAAAQVQATASSAQAALGWSLGLSIFAAALAVGTVVYVATSDSRSRAVVR